MELNLLKGIKVRYLFIQMFFTLFLGVIAMIIFGKVFNCKISPYNVELISSIITFCWFLLAIRFLKKYNIKLTHFIGKPLKKRFIFEVPVSFLITYIGGVGFILIILSLLYKINPQFLNSLSSKLKDEPHNYMSTSMIIVGFIGSVIVAPITEEIIFRGILLKKIYSKCGVKKSILYSSLIFFIIHLRPNPILLFLGISCAILVYKYKSLVPGMILHMINNFIVFFRDLKSTTNGDLSENLNGGFGLLIIGTILFFIYLVYIYKNYPKNTLKKDMQF